MNCEVRRLTALVMGMIFWGAVVSPANGQQTDAESGDVSGVVTKAYRVRIDGQVDEAKQLLEAELSAAPNGAAAWFELARVEFQRGGVTRELDSAQNAIERAVELAPENARYHCWASRIAIYNGILDAHSDDRSTMVTQMKKAIAAAEQAVSLDPDDHEARRLLVSLYGNNPAQLGGDRQKALAQVEAIEARSAIDGARARCEFSLKNETKKKLALWHELAAEHDKDSRVQENLAREYAWSGDVEEATTHANQALTLDPSRGRVLLDVARAFALQGKPEPAEKFARRYLALDSAAPASMRAWAQMALGRIEQIGGDNEAATKSFEQARAIDPYCWFTMTPPPAELFLAP